MNNLIENIIYKFLIISSNIVSSISFNNRKKLSLFIGYLSWLVAVDSKRTARKNLKVIFKKYNRKKFDNYIKKMFFYYSQNIVDFLAFNIISNKELKTRVILTKEDREYLDQKTKNGAIMLTAHFGNWEILGIVYGKLYNMHSFYLRPKLKKLGEFIVKKRELSGSRMVERENIKKVLKILNNNGVIGALADHDGGPTGLITNFFNKKVSVPIGVASLSYKTNVPIILSFVYHLSNGIYKIKVCDIIYPDKKNNKKNEIKNITEKFIKIYEKVILEHPEEWMLIYDRWKPRRHV